MNTIEMSRKDFAKKILERVESRLVKEGYTINEDVDDEGDAGGTPDAWEKYIRDAIALSKKTKEEFRQEKKNEKLIEYFDIEGRKRSPSVVEGTEYYDKLIPVTSTQYKKGKIDPSLWNDMISLVNEIIAKKGLPKMYELDKIRNHKQNTGGKTSTSIRVNWVDIDAFNVIGFDNFYNKLCKNIIEYPERKWRCGYIEPVSLVDKTGTIYNATLNVEWNFDPVLKSVYGNFILKDMYDIDEPETEWDLDPNTREGRASDGKPYIGKIQCPLEHSIKRNLNDERPSVEGRLFAESVKRTPVWFDVYINAMDKAKMDLTRPDTGFVSIKPLSEVTAEEIINNVNAATIE